MWAVPKESAMTTRPVPPRNTILVLLVIYGAIAAVACREHTPREGAAPSAAAAQPAGSTAR